LYEEIYPDRALQAFYNSCIHYDIGKHGCYNAGRMAEKMGDVTTEIIYYRLSNFRKSKLRMNELTQNSLDN